MTSKAKTEILTRDEWESLWAQLEPGKTASLGSYADRCNELKRQWLKDHPSLTPGMISNGRYVVYLERLLEHQAVTLPDSIISSITDGDMEFDAHTFPLLRAQVFQTERQ